MTGRADPEWAVATLVFVDIRGFTALAHRSTAREAVEYLDEFFAVVVPVVTGHGGRVDKLLGDGLLAVFEAAGHADRAVAAGREMLAAVASRFPVGVGINSGLVLMGAIGPPEAAEVGVIGDPVNVAARVQDATRDLGEPLLLTEATRLLLDSAVPLEPCGVLALRGRPEPVTVHRPAARNGSRTVRA